MKATFLTRRRVALLFGTAALLAACGGDDDSAQGASPSPSPSPPPPGGAPTAATFRDGLVNPWGMAFLPDGRILVTERPGRMRLVSADGSTMSAALSGLPAVHAVDQGGLLDVAIDPDFATTPWVYWSYSEDGSGGNGTAVARGQLSGNSLTNVQVIFRQAPKVGGDGHYGSRLVFASDNTLFVTLGERQQGSPAQDVGSHLGKVVRINRDGSVPSGNPNFGAGAQPELWSIGHRNPQGAALHPTTGELWLNEHGPQGGDEINIARAGSNYGWPNRSYGCNYGDPPGPACQLGGGAHAPDYVEPLTTWVPTSIAPSGMAFYTGAMFPEWQGNVFIGALAGRALWRITLAGNTVSAREALFGSLNERIRAVTQGPDGALYLLTDNDNGRIVRIHR